MLVLYCTMYKETIAPKRSTDTRIVERIVVNVASGFEEMYICLSAGFEVC